jgi:hypothetical protein
MPQSGRHEAHARLAYGFHDFSDWVCGVSWRPSVEVRDDGVIGVFVAASDVGALARDLEKVDANRVFRGLEPRYSAVVRCAKGLEATLRLAGASTIDPFVSAGGNGALHGGREAPFWSVRLTAQVLGITPRAVRYRAAKGAIPGATQNERGDWLIPRSWSG